MTTDKLPTTLEECHELIRRLEEENRQLRHAGSVFGQLAERLNQELRSERGIYSPGGILPDRPDDAWRSES